MKTGSTSSINIINSLRLNGGFHLSEAITYENKIRKRNYLPLAKLTSKIFTAGRSKRMYVSSDFGIPYLSNGNVVSANPIESCKYVSRKYSSDKESFLLEKMILVGRVGAIGNVAYVRKDMQNSMGSDNIIRVLANGKVPEGYLYAFFLSRVGNSYFHKLATGGVQSYISEDMLFDLPIPILSSKKQIEIHNLIEIASEYRSKANLLLERARVKLLSSIGLEKLRNVEYEYFGSHSSGRPISAFVEKNISSISLAAFNNSKRIHKIKKRVEKNSNTYYLGKCLTDTGFFNTGSFKRLEIKSSKAIKLINQTDIFDSRIKGKYIAPLFVKNQDLVSYGEVLIAGVGTLGENETFCRAIFAGEELEGQLVSGEFIRMKTTKEVPPGYLYTWLSTDYAFRMIRSTQAGTKLCRPILKLLTEIPVPIIDKQIMNRIDREVKAAHSKRFEALQAENKAIKIIEDEIDSWRN